MKIGVTYESTDIEKLVRLDLVRQGMDVASARIEFVDNEVRVSIIGVVPDDPPPVVVAMPPPAPAKTTPPIQPPLTVVEGGNQPVDMSDVLGASRKVEAQTKPLYPKGERELMEGESTEFPGVPRR